MRSWIYNRVRAIALPDSFGNPPRVISASAADNPDKPFLLIAMGVESRFLGSTKSMRVQSIPFTVYVHDIPGSFLNIDNASKALKDNLPIDGAVVGNMSIFELVWTDTGEDGYDDHYSTNVRPVRFNMVTKSAG